MRMRSLADHAQGHHAGPEDKGFVASGLSVPAGSIPFHWHASGTGFVVVWADAETGARHGAARFFCETAVWASKHLGTYPTYIGNSRAFLTRIYQASAKRLNHEFDSSALSRLSGCICVLKRSTGWTLSFGKGSAVLMRGGRLPRLVAGDVLEKKHILHEEHHGGPASFPFVPGDRLGMMHHHIAEAIVSSDISLPADEAGLSSSLTSLWNRGMGPGVICVYERTEKPGS